MNQFRKLLPDVVAILLFAVISFAYFFPAVTEGRILAQHDAVAGIGAGHEMQKYQERTGERTRWTNSIFGGMPTYQLAPSYDSTDLLGGIIKAYHLFLPTYVWYVFVMLLGFYILLRAFDFRVWMAALGAVLWLSHPILHHHCCRSYLEADGAGLYPAYHCRYGAGLSGTSAGRSGRDGFVHFFPDCSQPSADELLLPVCHAVYGNSIWSAGET